MPDERTVEEEEDYKGNLLDNLCEEVKDIDSINGKIEQALRDLKNGTVYDLSKKGDEKKLSQQAAGVGLLLSAPEKSGSHGTHVIVDMLVPGGAAEKQFGGVIQPEDLIVAVRDDDKDKEYACTTGLSVQEVKRLIVGSPGSTVSLQLRRPESGEVYECRGLIRGLENFKRRADQETEVEPTAAAEQQGEGLPRSRMKLKAKLPTDASPQQIETAAAEEGASSVKRLVEQVSRQEPAAGATRAKDLGQQQRENVPGSKDRSWADLILMFVVLVGLVASVLVQLQGQGTLAAHERMLREEMEVRFQEKEKKFNCTPVVQREQEKCHSQIHRAVENKQREHTEREKQLLATTEANTAKKSTMKAKEIFRRVVHEFVEYHDRWDEMPLKPKKNSLEDEYRAGIMKLLRKTRDMVH